jgi:Ca2+-binding EF-hand superfamily protein
VKIWATVIELLEMKAEATVRVEEIFEAAAESSSGNLDIQVLISVFTSFAIELGPDELDALHSDLNSNFTGRISLIEFLTAVEQNKQILTATQVGW